MLTGKKGLIVGIANEHSLAYGCARHFRAASAELAITYLNAKAEPYVRPLAAALDSDIVMPCDVTIPGQLDAIFTEIEKRWKRLDFLLHSVAYARRRFAWSHHRLLGRRIRICDAGFRTLVSAYGQACGAFDDIRRLLARHELLRCPQSGEPLQYHGASQGGA